MDTHKGLRTEMLGQEEGAAVSRLAFHLPQGQAQPRLHWTRFNPEEPEAQNRGNRDPSTQSTPARAVWKLAGGWCAEAEVCVEALSPARGVRPLGLL